jgi:hypothetical protein
MKMITYSAVGLKAGFIFKSLGSALKKKWGQKGEAGERREYRKSITKWSQPETVAVVPRLGNRTGLSCAESIIT